MSGGAYIESEKRVCGSVMKTFHLYYFTLTNMKLSQVYHRLRTKMGKGASLGVDVIPECKNTARMPSLAKLDFDAKFLARFSAEELMMNSITILHCSKQFDWRSSWTFSDKSDLWNFNLHYFDYLFPLLSCYFETGDKKYLDKTMEMIAGWMDANPERTYPAWASYTTALRIVNWMIYFGYVGNVLSESFKSRFLKSLHDQYRYLSKHLEKDILGNHYFEDLKCLVLTSLFFEDEAVLFQALQEFKKECREEILADGMHFELSPMYHKIVFEGMLRVAKTLQGCGRRDLEIESYLQSMLDVAYSFEVGLHRIPLFNDGGNNVAKSLEALVETAKDHFNLEPMFKTSLCESGFFIFENHVVGTDGKREIWRLIVDAGNPGPAYIPGHAHCDAMSFELFCDGKPVIVNCGTYDYQCSERTFFRNTAAHNTVMVTGVEQSQCWGVFRMAKRAHVKVLNLDQKGITIEMIDQKRNFIRRNIWFSDHRLHVEDRCVSRALTSHIHLGPKIKRDSLLTTCAVKWRETPYAEDYGLFKEIWAAELTGDGSITYDINLSGETE